MAEGARVAIVTGSESGIGRAVAVALAEQGCDIGVTWYREKAAAEATAEEVRALGRRAEVRHLDLTRLPGAADVVDELADALGGVDVLVNNSGTGTSTSPACTSTSRGSARRPTARLRAGWACSPAPQPWSSPSTASPSTRSP